MMGLRQIFLGIAALLLTLAFFVAVGWLHSDWEAWATAGLVFFVVSFLLSERPVAS